MKIKTILAMLTVIALAATCAAAIPCDFYMNVTQMGFQNGDTAYPVNFTGISSGVTLNGVVTVLVNQAGSKALQIENGEGITIDKSPRTSDYTWIISYSQSSANGGESPWCTFGTTYFMQSSGSHFQYPGSWNEWSNDIQTDGFTVIALSSVPSGNTRIANGYINGVLTDTNILQRPGQYTTDTGVMGCGTGGAGGGVYTVYKVVGYNGTYGNGSCTITPPCTEDWVESEVNVTGCLNGTQELMDIFTDQNQCGTYNNVPEINGSIENTSCTYCEPRWECNGYGDCNTSDYRSCNSVGDEHECNITYGGDYSAFAPQGCNYCSENIEVSTTTWSQCLEFKQTRTAYYQDLNLASCCEVTGLQSDCDIHNNTFMNITETQACGQSNDEGPSAGSRGEVSYCSGSSCYGSMAEAQAAQAPTFNIGGLPVPKTSFWNTILSWISPGWKGGGLW